jgi:adenosylcobinamide kinase / adenosylcobinamide-phosphate guanylyltransferase
VITLVLGGARSGKSEVAERLAAALPAPLTYVATLTLGDDADLAARIAIHRERRPEGWKTVEAGADLPHIVRETGGSILLDSLGPWVAGHEGAAVDRGALCDALSSRVGDMVIVSEEVGLGVHPSSEAGRWFRDELGRLNQDVAAVSDEVLLVVAGRVLRLEGP